MKYQPIATAIPQDKRESINDTILQIIDSGELPEGITYDDIYNGYTGIGGLHGLSRADYNNYNEYSEAKKEIEQGQFFTPGTIVEQMAQLLQVQAGELVADLSCGAGAFFNSFKEHQCYGIDIDQRAIKVAKFLYPGAHIEVRNIRFYEPGVKFDYVIGNPPFNLRWDTNEGEVLSQLYYCKKAAELLKPAGIMCIVMPDNFLRDVFFQRSMVEELDEQFNFLFQYKLQDNAFAALGVSKYETKVMCFQKHAAAIPSLRKYHTDYVSYEQAAEDMKIVQGLRHKVKAKLRSEQALQFEDGHAFEYKMKKYLYEIKTHKILRTHLARATAHVDKLYHQKQPEGMSDKEWAQSKLTPNKVLAYLKDIMNKQWEKPRDEYQLVQTNYGFKMKAYSDKAKLQMNKMYDQTYWPYNKLVRYPHLLQRIGYMIKGRGLKKLMERKVAEYERQTQSFNEMQRDPKVDAFLNKFGFRNAKYEVCRFNDFQKEDLGLMLQKDYGILNWQQGSGKTPAAAAWMAYRKQRNTFIIGPAVAINMTWAKFMKLHNKDFVNVRSYKDVQKIQPGMFVLMSLDMLITYERHIKKYVKMQGHKVNLVFDESDEITNAAAKRTRAVLNCFRRARRKLLTTGTTTRNNINELYSQLELLYNNSVNMICHAEHYYVEEVVKVKDTLYPEDAGPTIKRKDNPYFDEPFPPFYGSTTFKRCFNPEKSTVFGIKKHNQDLYNQEHLTRILEYTIRTRKFKQIAGDKYTVSTIRVDQNPHEEEVYRMIIEELNVILPAYFSSTGNARKDAMLKIIRQLQLLIQATSMPQYFKEYGSDTPSSKAEKIFELCDKWNEKVAIGCTTIEAVDYYVAQLTRRYPGRAIFKVVGDVSFNSRDKIRAAFESTHNGILVSTQQSLKSSVNIPSCNKVIIESMQWNIPKIEQYFFRFIRYDSKDNTEVWFINYNNTIEINLMALLMTKERLNDFIKTLEYKDSSDVYDEYGVDLDILNSILTKEEVKDEKGNTRMQISWGKAQLV